MREGRQKRGSSARAELAFALCLLVLCACVCTEVVLYSQNTLYLKSDWLVGKRMLVMGVSGADDVLLSRSSLAGNTLHLGAWFGYHEVLLRAPVEPSAVQFSFRVAEAGHVSFIWGHTGLGFSGLRLSRHPTLPSAVFRADGEGGITSEAAIPMTPITSGWHRIVLRFEGRGLSGQVDGLAPFRVEGPSTAPGRVGFRNGGEGEVDIDDVVIHSEGRPVFRESFQNRAGWLRLNALDLAALSAVAGLLALMWRLRAEPVDWHHIGLRVSTLTLGCTLSAAAFFVFDFYHLSHLPLDSLTWDLPTEHTPTVRPSFETIRFQVFQKWYRLAGGETIVREKIARMGYPMNRIFVGPVFCGPEGAVACSQVDNSDLAGLLARHPNSYRMMFVGTSQTIGAGADTLDRTFFVRVHERLVEALGAARPLESVNVAISAGHVRQLLNRYRRRYLELSPNLVVINFGNNDGGDDLRAGISGFLELNQARGISTVLLEEANAVAIPRMPAQPMPWLDGQHQILRALAATHEVPIWGMHAFLGSPDTFRSGFVWWDHVHLTSHGQHLLADWLTAKLLPVIGAPPGTTDHLADTPRIPTH